MPQRDRRLVVSFWTTIANYEYGFFVYFHRSGHIDFEVKLTGILSVGVVDKPGESRKYGILLDGDRLYAPIHQHCFVARMHMAVDSDGLSGNRVVELNAEKESPGPHNPHNNAFFYRETVLESELKAIRRAPAPLWAGIDRPASTRGSAAQTSEPTVPWPKARTVRRSMGCPAQVLLVCPRRGSMFDGSPPLCKQDAQHRDEQALGGAILHGAQPQQ